MERVPQEQYPPYLEKDERDDETLWRAKLGEAENVYRHFSDIVGEEGPKKIYDDLLFVAEFSEEEKDQYLKSVSRFSLALFYRGGAGVGTLQSSSLFEARKLWRTIGKDHPELLGNYIHMAGYYGAHARNSNTYGDEFGVSQKIIGRAAEEYERKGDIAAHDALVNPFRLATGTEVFFFDPKQQKIKKDTLDVFVEGGRGLVVFDGGKRQENIEIFNAWLADGKYMLRDGENHFGGVEYLDYLYHSAAWHPGSKITIDARLPLQERDEKREVIEVVGSNIEAVEKEYGKSYLAFINKFPKDKPLVTADLKSTNGNVVENFDPRALNIIS